MEIVTRDGFKYHSGYTHDGVEHEAYVKPCGLVALHLKRDVPGGEWITAYPKFHIEIDGIEYFLDGGRHFTSAKIGDTDVMIAKRCAFGLFLDLLGDFDPGSNERLSLFGAKIKESPGVDLSAVIETAISCHKRDICRICGKYTHLVCDELCLYCGDKLGIGSEKDFLLIKDKLPDVRKSLVFVKRKPCKRYCMNR